jgi:hypothetical protein
MRQTMAPPIDEVFATAGRLDEYRPYQTIATDDIAKLVALASDRPEDFIRSELEIAASELTNPPGGPGVRAWARAPCHIQAPADAHRPGRARQGVLSNVPLGSTTAATKPTSRDGVPAIPSGTSGRLRTGGARRAGRASAR